MSCPCKACKKAQREERQARSALLRADAKRALDWLKTESALKAQKKSTTTGTIKD